MRLSCAQCASPHAQGLTDAWRRPTKENAANQPPTNGVHTKGKKVERAGVGIILAMSSEGHLYVHTVCPGSSAEKHLIPGDVLVKIGETDVLEVCMHVCMVFIYASMTFRALMYACMYVYMYMYMYVCKFAWFYAYVCPGI
jgi:hypothetical protein